MALVASAIALWGIWAAWHYHALGLTLSHYDAKGHLVVARRVFDSLTPGWEQIGAVWLPLPHLLNMVPVQVDAFYRTGASAVAISIASFAIACAAAYRAVERFTGSIVAAATAVLLLSLNPNLLYLQATPMTEPLLLATLMVSVLCLQEWIAEPTSRRTLLATSALAAACLTRYEAWPFTIAGLALAAAGRWRSGDSLDQAVARAARLAVGPIVAVLGFLLLSKLSTNHWFVTDGFYVVDQSLAGRPWKVTGTIWYGLRQLGTSVLAWTALPAAAVVAVVSFSSGRRAPVMVALALGAVAALPWYAFYQGHPFRVRYLVPLLAGAAIGTAMVIGLLPRRARFVLAVLVVAITALLQPPFSPRAAMVLEAQWDSPNRAARAQITPCLARRQPGEPILASMGSLAHYMQELSAIGLGIRDFIHEGNGQIWIDAIEAPERHVSWILMEERSEGGDVLARRAAQDPEYLRGFVRRCEGGGVALYRRN